MTASLPPGQIVYAIGDIHGRSDLLASLLRQIEADARGSPDKQKTLVFVGDYVDRGPDSRRVVDLLLNSLPRGFNARFLKGNHEAMLLDFLTEPGRLDQWLLNGGAATMASYGVDIDALEQARARPGTWRDAFAAVLPEAHLDFFKQLELSLSLGDYLFVHAGVRPEVPLEAQTEIDLVWIRAPFLDWTGPFGKMVVHGHTPGKAPVIRANRIGIDTGACFSNRLTALRLEGESQKFLQT
ncbi:MAG: metallophosphoesterase family protein [Methyloceanibacter sp.]